jgi:hypothetical protein
LPGGLFRFVALVCPCRPEYVTFDAFYPRPKVEMALPLLPLYKRKSVVEIDPFPRPFSHWASGSKYRGIIGVTRKFKTESASSVFV